ncbi:MAG: hypothetical protein KJ646_04130 [Nanoarchaeota archaeon]|nr:hypothetical protein [Nanoarchaeota archaeon]
MNKKTILIITGIFLVIGIGVLAFIFLNNPEPVEKCGDGICDEKEKQKNICPQDCKSAVKGCKNENEFCGGIAGIKCCSGLTCEYDGDYPDAGGVCAKGGDAQKSCSKLGGNICSSSQTCSGSWLDASDSAMCCSGGCGESEHSDDFISGFKLQNTENIRELNEITFSLAKELGLDYVLVPVTFPRNGDVNNIDWSLRLDYYYIFELSEKYDVSVYPSFFKLGGEDDKNPDKYAEFVISFLDEFYIDENIKHIEFQNEPTKDYDGKDSARFEGTPTDLAMSNIATYNKVKAKYPAIQVGTPGFMAAAVNSDENIMMNEYYDEYLKAGAKFDVFNLHQYPKISSYLQTKEDLNVKYNFMSEYEILKTYRKMLNDYGFNDKPILVTEGNTAMPYEDGSLNWISDDEAKILLAERYVTTLSQSKDNQVIGSMISSIESDSSTALFQYNKETTEYSTTEKFEFYKKLLDFFEIYPLYSKHISGSINSNNVWVEEFKNSEGDNAWVAFCPFLFKAEAQSDEIRKAIAYEKSIVFPQDVTFDVGNIKSVKISTLSDSWTVEAVNGKVSFSLGKEPVFIEEK